MLKAWLNRILSKQIDEEKNVNIGTDKDLALLKNMTTPEMETIPANRDYMKHEFQGNIGDSNAYIGYYFAYNTLFDETEAKLKANAAKMKKQRAQAVSQQASRSKKSKVFVGQTAMSTNMESMTVQDVFNVGQGTFLYIASHFPFVTIQGTIGKQLLKNIVSKRMREFRMEFDLPEEIKANIEIMAFRDNSIILRIKPDEAVMQKMYQKMQDSKEEFVAFMVENDKLMQFRILQMTEDNQNSDEAKLYQQEQDKNIKMAHATYKSSFKILMSSLKNGVLIDITDLSAFLPHLLSVTSLMPSNKKAPEMLAYNDMDDMRNKVVAYLKNKRLMHELRKKRI